MELSERVVMQAEKHIPTILESTWSARARGMGPDLGLAGIWGVVSDRSRCGKKRSGADGGFRRPREHRGGL